MIDVLIPASPLATAKGRLADLLTVDERGRVLAICLQTVIVAVLEAGFRPVVLTSDPRVRALAGPNVRFISENPAPDNLNQHLEDAILSLGSPQELLILHADLPLITGTAVRQIVTQAGPAPSVVIVESNDGGTNAMLLRPPRSFELAYGPRSASRHSAAASTAGLAVSFVDIPELRLDLDTPTDVFALLASPAGAATPAGSYLASLDLDSRREARA